MKKSLPDQVHNPPRQARFHFLCPDMRIQNNSFNHVLNTIKVFENITKPSKHLSAFIKSTLDLKDCSNTPPFACFRNVQTWEIYFIPLKHWKKQSHSRYLPHFRQCSPPFCVFGTQQFWHGHSTHQSWVGFRDDFSNALRIENFLKKIISGFTFTFQVAKYVVQILMVGHGLLECKCDDNHLLVMCWT